ncbi:MAG: DUF6438 domain-containing protein [Vicingaceae bacterium]
MRITLFIVLLFSFIVACKSKKVQSETVDNAVTNTPAIEKETTGFMEEAQSNLPDSLFARLQRTSCFGHCPIYTVSFYAEGYVLYQGEKWVELEGNFYSHASEKQLSEIRRKAEAIDFFELKEQYDNEHVTDLPSTITTLKGEEGFKVVANRYEGPEQLKEFEKLIDEIVDSLEWKEVESD